MGRALTTMARSVGKGEGEAGDVAPMAKEVGRRIREHNRRELNQQFTPLGP